MANAIEFAFGQMNRAIARNRQMANRTPKRAIREALRGLTTEQCTSWVRHSRNRVREWLPHSDWWQKHPGGF
jgi:hypothetical protein